MKPRDQIVAGARPAGRRERNKRAKESAIREAARELFIRKGYDATTLREIARAANVGFGTLFAYSHDKAGLLAMIFVEQLASLPPLFSDLREDEPLGDMLVRAFASLYRFWASVPTLSNHVLQQMEFFQANPYVDMIVERREAARTELAEWVSAMQAKGAISGALDAAAVSATLFAVYTSAIREWSATTPEDVDRGLADLRRLLEVVIRGLRG